MSEAGIMSEVGVQAIASTIINRMYSEYFPNTFTEVLYQKNAFSVVNDGSLFRTNPSKKVLDNIELAMYNDNSNGSLYFLNVSLCYEQGYGHNAEHMLRAFDKTMILSGVTFLKNKGE